MAPAAFSSREVTRPEEIADLIAFLASPAAATITGHTVNINGGLYFGG